MIKLEKIESIIKNYLLGDYEYFTDQADFVGDTSSIVKQKDHDASKYFFRKLFNNADFYNNGKEKFNNFRLDISPGVYLIAEYCHSQFILSVFYHGTSLNLYRYYNSTSIAGFKEFDLFKEINLNDFYKLPDRYTRHHEYHMICVWDKDFYKFLKLGVVDDTIYVNKTFMYEILGERNRGSFEKDCLEILGVKHIVFQKYTYSLTETFKIPSTLETVSFNLTKDSYNSIKEQQNRIMSQDKGLKPFIKDKKLQEQADNVAKHDEDVTNHNTPVVLNYKKDKGVVLTNLYAYNNFKNSCNDEKILSNVKMEIVGYKSFEKMLKHLPSMIGETSWFKKEFEVLEDIR